MSAEANTPASGNPVSDHLDIWSSVTVKKSASGRGSNSKLSAYGIQKLREMILELAVHGKLVPQDPNDEPASVLLEKIAEEKARLGKEGELWVRKKISKITDKEKPFELPNNWVWARFPDICDYRPGKTPSTKNPTYWSEDEGDTPWASIADMTHFGTVTNTSKKITQEAIDKVFKYDPISAGSILMSFKLTVGKISILEIDGYHNEAIISIKPFTGMYRDYLFKILPTRALAGNTKRAIMGHTLNATSLSLLLIPVPPLSEQHRIVAKVDELMAICDQLEQQQTDSITAHQTLVETLLRTLTEASDAQSAQQAWTRIAEHFDTLLTTIDAIDQLKQTILQLAVMGKLVPQDPNDKPASVLLEKIAEEKVRLVEEGKIKKQKVPPEISEDEKPFPLPEGWEWVRLGTIAAIRGGKRVSNGYKLLVTPTPYIYIRVSDMKDGSIDDSDLRYIDECMYSKIRQYIITKADIYMTIVGATIGKCGLVPTRFDSMNLTENAARISPYLLFKVYLFRVLTSSLCQDQFIDKTKQVGVQKMALNRLASTLLPLPPLAEQHRIVVKVDILMVLCDALKARIQDTQTTQTQLADAIVEQVVA